MFATLAFAQEMQNTAKPESSPLMSFLPLILIFLIFYFVLIKPQKKAQQEHAKILSNLKKNDEVVTSGGIFGTVVNLQDDVVTIRIDDNVRVKVQRKNVAGLVKARSAEAK